MRHNPEAIDALELFHPLVRRWFRERVGAPTDIQVRAWPEIAGGRHVLVTAPTGSGKTLTAFLWAINDFLVNHRSGETGRVLYVSPLKALNNDIRRNLERPLEELREYFAAADTPFPRVRTAVRSGDTEPSERRQMARYPPDILITTPESLNILLASRSGSKLLKGISTVILDEIHAVYPTKRGTYLITAVDRLVPLNGEFQRIALSATVKPLVGVADFVGGYRVEKYQNAYGYEKRPVTVVQSDIRKRYDIAVHFPEGAVDPQRTKDWWRALTEAFRREIARHRSTLFFANSRRMVEKVARFINESGAPEDQGDRIYSHHGSLAREIRAVVEKRFKEGELSAIIATSSLELGIDIGAVDQVVLIQAPFSIASAIQRIGRSGHGVGQVSRGTFYPLHSFGFVEAAVLAAQVDDGEIEETRPVMGPLDVLAQVLLSMTVQESRDIDALFGEIRASFPYHRLDRREFDLVIEMLAGRYADSRIRELKPRLLVDRLKNTARARDNASMLLFLSGGVIPDRGYYNLRIAESKARIGELDEEFVWERSLGDAFPLGNQIWRIQRITHNDVEVTRVKQSNSLVPFWRAEEMNRSFHLSEKIGQFLEKADTHLQSPAFRTDLLEKHHLGEAAAEELIRYLERQRKETEAGLPHRHHLLVEHFHDPVNRSDAKQTVLHTLWGGRVNRPLALALSAAWEEKYRYPLQVFVNNDCILLNLPHEFSAAEIVSLVKPDSTRRLLRARLESTGYFGARFRENAQRALLLPRRSFHQRMPLWLNRLRSKKLLEAVSRYRDFPILLETWRGCMNHDFEIDTLHRLLEEIASGEIRVTETVTRKPSPFAEGIIWRQTSYFMYEDDSPEGKLRSSLSDQLMKEVMYSPHLRPRFSPGLIRSFREKIQRVAPGYSPATADELLLWVKERLFIPAGEWEELLSAVERDRGVKAGVDVNEKDEPPATTIEESLYQLGEDRQLQGVMARENLGRLRRVLALDPLGAPGNGQDPDGSELSPDENGGKESLVGFLNEWLRFYGPVSRDFLCRSLGLEEECLSAAVETLVEEGNVIEDEFRSGDGPGDSPLEICDSGNVEILLRMRRAAARPAFEPLEAEALPLFLAAYQRLTSPGEGPEDLRDCLEQLFGFPARAGLWEGDILPARLHPYYIAWLDSALGENDLIWFGCGKERLGFCFDSDYELFVEPTEISEEREAGDREEVEGAAALETIFSTHRGKLGFEDILDLSKLPSPEAAGALWNLAWQGRITNDQYQTVRSGILNRFRPLEIPRGRRMGGRRPRRVGFNRWQSARPFTGNWYLLKPPGDQSVDALDRQEIVKDRIRQLLMRYGILFRELLWNELPWLRWSRVFPVLRLMELSGEITSGHFFKGVPGLQFCSPRALTLLKEGLPEASIYWMNAADPASLCGIPLEELKGALPPRLPTTHLVFRGRKPVLVSRRNGRELDFSLPPDHPEIHRCLAFFKTLVGRKFQPLKYIQVETVNGEPAPQSAYRQSLVEFGFHKDYKTLTLMKSY